jgi:hypothetical protein
LPQNPPINSLKNAMHNCGANVEPHGLFPLIYSGFFQTTGSLKSSLGPHP